ncbi:MAG: tRNA lysidine(34) synthetase TilS, partial [Bacteroidetes bacterium]|nr:tRNA lysidine(34) synthetase TilS [Bacteroidota bacterium]
AFDGDEVTFPLLIRVWHEGDRIKPFGMNGSKLVSDVYNEHSVLIRDRQLRPMVLQGDTIIWLPGLRRSIHAPVRSTTQKIIQITSITHE